MNKFKTLIAMTMSLIMTNVPSLALAEGMISTNVVVEQMTHTETQAKVDQFLQQDEIRAELTKQGLSIDEVRMRLASLSPRELQDLSAQMDQARAGGSILVTVLLVVLIIFIVKRL